MWTRILLPSRLSNSSLVARHSTLFLGFLLCLLASVGCGEKQSTDELIAAAKSGPEGDRIRAVRFLQHRVGNPAVVPVLIDALKDSRSDIRHSAAVGLGYAGAAAKDAVPALQKLERDKDARVREAAGVALSRIDPEQFRSPYLTARPAGEVANKDGAGKKG
jgi:HEAT repeat protein